VAAGDVSVGLTPSACASAAIAFPSPAETPHAAYLAIFPKLAGDLRLPLDCEDVESAACVTGNGGGVALGRNYADLRIMPIWSWKCLQVDRVMFRRSA
jgi:hypothetical protein